MFENSTAGFSEKEVPAVAITEINYKKKEVTTMVELDALKTTLASYTEPLLEVRDSL